MTDAMSRREIEDVLSSIRRLVSHDVPPSAPFVQAGRSGPSAGSFSGEKLLLTSALRVDAQGGEAQAAAARSDTEVKGLPVSGPLTYGLGASMSIAPDDPEAAPVMSEMPPPDMTLPDMTLPDMATNDMAASAPAQPDVPQDSAEASMDETGPGFAPHIPSLLARISGVGRHPEAEPDLSYPGPAFGRSGLGPQDVANVPEDTEAPIPGTMPDDPQPVAPSVQTIEDSALETTLARLEELLAGAVRDDGNAVARGDAEHSEDLIDEGVLYQLVAHIVRQELQGELGEKITRNIRKLVRAEVARELQLRQF